MMVWLMGHLCLNTVAPGNATVSLLNSAMFPTSKENLGEVTKHLPCLCASKMIVALLPCMQFPLLQGLNAQPDFQFGSLVPPLPAAPNQPFQNTAYWKAPTAPPTAGTSLGWLAAQAGRDEAASQRWSLEPAKEQRVFMSLLSCSLILMRKAFRRAILQYWYTRSSSQCP